MQLYSRDFLSSVCGKAPKLQICPKTFDHDCYSFSPKFIRTGCLLSENDVIYILAM